jgi:hypothetical protein
MKKGHVFTSSAARYQTLQESDMQNHFPSAATNLPYKRRHPEPRPGESALA